MTATLEQTETQKMSVIFPTEPPLVHIHTLPKNSEHITYCVSDYLSISAWMPSDFHEINQMRTETDDEFYSNNCEGCERNTYTFLEEYMDEDGEVNWEMVPGGRCNHCFVYHNGYEGQYCPEGNKKESYDFALSIPNMVFEISINYMNNHYDKFASMTDSAYLCAGRIENGEFLTTQTLSASNVFGTDEFPESICWGYNRRPDTLREIVIEYFATPFNNDLLSLNGFEENSYNLRKFIRSNYFDVDHSNIYLCNGSDADALMLLDAENNISAFFSMLSAGFEPIESAPHIMMIPIQEVSIEKNGNEFYGYQTPPDAMNKRWFITMDGFLIGQI